MALLALLLYYFLAGSMLESLSGRAHLRSQSEHKIHSILRACSLIQPYINIRQYLLYNTK